MTRTRTSKVRRAALRAAGKHPDRPACPTPAKRAYETEEAIHKALRSSRFIGKPIGIYECQCGTLHLTKRVRPIKKAAA